MGRNGSSDAGTEMKSPKSLDADAGVGSSSGSTSEIEWAGTGINGGIDLSEDIV